MSEPVMNGKQGPATMGAAVPEWLSVVREQVRGMQFGVVQIVVHDSTVVQIERTERLRLGRARTGEKGG